MAEENKNLRNIVLNMLAETLEKGAFSHIVVNDTFSRHDINAQERAFISRLYLGVLERLIYLDFCINRVSKTNTAKMKPVVLNILRLGTYQLLFMDAVPDHAALNEAGKLAKKRGFSQLVPFINGVLRSIQRDGREKAEEDMPENVRLSVPKWMYENAVESFGEEAARSFFENSLNPENKVTIRLNEENRRKLGKQEVISLLEDEGCQVQPADREGDSFYLSGFTLLTALKAYKAGFFTVQDRSSVRAALTGCRALESRLGIERSEASPLIIDVCAAPGGKSICAAQYFPKGMVISRDLSQGKTDLINENIERLGLKNIKTEVYDATAADEKLRGQADMVIADLPCSGLGVIGGKPDIKFRVRKKDLEQLEKLQRDILAVVQSFVKPGGILLYSTCTINMGENSDNADWLSEFSPIFMVQVL